MSHKSSNRCEHMKLELRCRFCLEDYLDEILLEPLPLQTVAENTLQNALEKSEDDQEGAQGGQAPQNSQDVQETAQERAEKEHRAAQLTKIINMFLEAVKRRQE